MPGYLPGKKPTRSRRERTSSPVFSRSLRVLILSAVLGAGHLRAVQMDARPRAPFDIVDGVATLLRTTPPGGLPAIPTREPASGERSRRRRAPR